MTRQAARGPPESPVSAARRSQRSVLGWLIGQLVVFVRVLLQPVVGPVLAVIERRFHYRAFLTAFVTLTPGVAGLAALLWADPFGLGERRQDVLWPGVLAVATLAGILAGRVGRRVGGWEIYMAVLATAAIYYVHLAKGWHVLLGIGGSDVLSAWDLAAQRPLGEQYFGELWDRVLGLIAAAALVLGVFGGSLSFLLFSDAGRLDARLGLEWFVGRRHLAREGRGVVSLTAIVAIVGIALGVGALVAVTAVMSGYQEDIRDKILSTNAHLVVQKYGLDFTEHAQIAEKALRVDGVVAAAPFVFNEAMLADGERGLGVLVKGVAPAAAAVTDIEQNLCRPAAGGACPRLSASERRGGLAAWLTPRDGAPAVIIGAELLKKIDLLVGSSVLLTTPVGISRARGSAPRRMEFRVAGAFRSGMHEFDSRLVYVDLAAGRQLLGMGEAVNGVELRVREPERVDVVGRAVLRAVGRYPFRTLDWRELNAGIFTALNLQKIVMFLVLAFIVVVAAFNIASTLFMAVVERAHEIAVLKSMGARDASIMKVFVMQGWVVGTLGTVFGVALGLVVCALLAEVDIGIAADVYMVESLRVRVWPLEILLIAGATLVISHLATVYPALRAARQRPVDAMRYE